MADSLATIDLLLRGGAVALLGVLAAALVRERTSDPVLRIGALFALGGAAYAVCSTPGFHDRAGVLAAPFLALTVGNNLVFWLFARSLFEDGFRFRRWHVVAWLALAAAGALNGLSPAGSPVHDVFNPLQMLQTVGFTLTALVQTARGWAVDLVEPRRRLRVILVGGAGLHALLSLAAGLSATQDSRPVLRLADVAVLALVALAAAWGLLRVSAGEVLPIHAQAPAPVPASDPADDDLLRRLDRLMASDLAYRDEALTIGRLAHRLDVAEYRLRRAINQGLGHRNFAAYLNGLRLAEARAALADPDQAAVPILTIALDAGFGSLGPFNRAFKAETGMTPSEYRRDALGLEDTAQAA